uniref:Uncharacterized protein n=1 Tax=uncultured bacterium pBE3-1 TaxID=1781161 RepID=A0A1C9U525_9BACT|nr:hypothetical protein [uncultured bacterium pBE3-1]
MERLTERRLLGGPVMAASWVMGGIGAVMIAWSLFFVPTASASHQGHASRADAEVHATVGHGYSIPGASFQIFLGQGKGETEGSALTQTDADAAVKTVMDAFALMLQHRADYPRFDESLKKEALAQVVIEPTVVNEEGKVFPFLVARTKEPGRVTLLISAALLKDKGYVHHPDMLAPVLAREFQWVVSKADTAPKPKIVSVERDLPMAPIRTDQDIKSLPADERARLLQRLFDTYLRTVDDQKSLDGQSYYEVGSQALVTPTHQDSTAKLYEIRIREALQKIVREPFFWEQRPKAVRSLLNGKVWNVAFVKIDQRDWATRTRVLPESRAVVVGEHGQRIQPAAILVNVYRTAAPDDPFYSDTQGLPMGALSADQLARVIASEIQLNIQEKSMTGHTAQDELTAPNKD